MRGSWKTVSCSKYFQQEAAIWLGVNNGKALYLPRCSRSTSETEYNGWLCALMPEGIVKIRKLDRSDNAHEKIAGFDGRFLYYWHVSDNELYSYDIETDQEKMIAAANSSLSYAVVFAEDGSLYIPSNSPQDFVHVRDGKLVSYTDEQAQYSSGEVSYYLRKQDSAGARGTPSCQTRMRRSRKSNCRICGTDRYSLAVRAFLCMMTGFPSCCILFVQPMRLSA